MRSKEELNALKEEVEALNKKLAELTEEELNQVTSGLPSRALERCDFTIGPWDPASYQPAQTISTWHPDP